jgi:hypothetical protein
VIGKERSPKDDQLAVHADPVWSDKQDTVVYAPLEESVDVRWEELPARQVSGTIFEICCIPFFVYDISLGDHVEIISDSTEIDRVVGRVVNTRGHYTFRLWFGESPEPTDPGKVIEEVARCGGDIEWSSKNLLAIDVPAGSSQRFADYLFEQAERGEFVYETGRTSE